MKKRATCFWCDSMNQWCVTSCVSVSIDRQKRDPIQNDLCCRDVYSFPSRFNGAGATARIRGYNHSILTANRFSIVSGCVKGTTTSLYSAGISSLSVPSLIFGQGIVEPVDPDKWQFQVSVLFLFILQRPCRHEWPATLYQLTAA